MIDRALIFLAFVILAGVALRAGFLLSPPAPSDLDDAMDEVTRW